MASSGRCMVVVALCLLILGDVSVAAESAINCNLGTDGGRQRSVLEFAGKHKAELTLTFL
ncbi:hypothetical protein C4D60_Mb05t30220 [Musa balbisiana]|uniref:Uncharacterized protein n=1 Tax=Musa balbisiana TaxID=52838 RepID=A0A4S8JZW2_MUSBA|nr:hypothetical protein C4D60_Mb05t30220 [Musa balbisiana]